MTTPGSPSRLTRPAAAVTGHTITAVAAAAGPEWGAAAVTGGAAVLTTLITSLALVTALSRKKYRRDAALAVLHLLLVETRAPAGPPGAATHSC
jgi:hypothetical protein